MCTRFVFIGDWMQGQWDRGGRKGGMGGVREGMEGRGQPLSAAVNTAASAGWREADWCADCTYCLKCADGITPSKRGRAHRVISVFCTTEENGTHMQHYPLSLSHTHPSSMCTTSTLIDTSCVPNCKLPLVYFTAAHVNAGHLLRGALVSTWMVLFQIVHRLFGVFFGFLPLLLL